MPPGRVVETVDVFADGCVADGVVGVVFVVNPLGLQRREEALGDGVDAPMFVKRDPQACSGTWMRGGS
jgi:hypothetical protein